MSPDACKQLCCIHVAKAEKCRLLPFDSLSVIKDLSFKHLWNTGIFSVLKIVSVQPFTTNAKFHSSYLFIGMELGVIGRRYYYFLNHNQN